MESVKRRRLLSNIDREILKVLLSPYGKLILRTDFKLLNRWLLIIGLSSLIGMTVLSGSFSNRMSMVNEAAGQPAGSIVSLVREQNQAPVFLVVGNTKLWIPNPSELFAAGFDWSKVQVVPDGSLSSLKSKPFNAPPTVKASDVFFNCRGDFDTLFGERYYTHCKNQSSIVKKNIIIAGWLREKPFINRWSERGVEDVLYDIKLDVEFINKMYGTGGLSTALNNAALPGNPPTGNVLPFTDVSRRRGVTLNSFSLPMTGDFHIELNAWHEKDTGSTFRSHFQGMGPHPAEWIRIPEVDRDVFWPYNPLNPNRDAVPLGAGDYVLIKGTLWEDSLHGDQVDGYLWDTGKSKGHSMWLEIHPADWILKIEEPNTDRNLTLRYHLSSLIMNPAEAPDHVKTVTVDLYPDFLPATGKGLEVRDVSELIDGRFTDMRTVSFHKMLNMKDHVQVQVGIHNLNDPISKQGRFKAAYIVSFDIRDVKQMLIKVEPSDIPLGHPIQVNIHAQDSQNHIPVSGRVIIDGKDVGTTNTPFTYTFNKKRINTFDPSTRTWEVDFHYPVGKVTAPGYKDAEINFGFVQE